MPEAGQYSISGRCPGCSQLVTLPSEALDQSAECPRCRHAAPGATFADLERALPVIVATVAATEVPRRASRVPMPRPYESKRSSLRPPPSIPPSTRPSAPPSTPPEATDEARTHLRLDPVDAREERTHLVIDPVQASLENDERTRLRLDPVAVEAREERTHLLLDPVEHTDEREPSVEPGAALVKPDEARTHLLLEPGDLEDERSATQSEWNARLGALARRFLPFSQLVGELLHGRRQVVLAVIAVAFGISAPMIDFLIDDQNATTSAIASLILMFGFYALGVAWFAQLENDAGEWDAMVAVARVRNATTLIIDDLRELDRSPRYLKIFTAGHVVSLIGLGCLGLASLRGSLRFVFGLVDPPSAFRFVSGLVLLGGVLLLRKAAALTPNAAPGPEDLSESLAAAKKLPALVDLSDPLPDSYIGEHTSLHRALIALSQWRGELWDNEAASRAALERHLQRQLPASRIERDKWLGRTRRSGIADLVIDDTVLIEVERGFSKAAAERARQRMEQHAQAWPGKPMLLAVLDAPREAVFESPNTAELVELHQRLPMLTARMPSRRW